MKKITLLLSLFISTISFSQSYHGIYVENATYDGPVTIENTFDRNSIHDPGPEGEMTNSTGSEGTNHIKLLIYDEGHPSDAFFMSQYEATPGVDLSAFSSGYYNISIKTNFPDAFYIRFQSGGDRQRITLDPTTQTYGHNNDEQWHTLSIPFVDFELFQGVVSFAAVDRPLVFRSITDPDLTQGYYIEFDGVFLSTTEVLNVESLEKAGISMYPNPASNEFNIKSLNIIDNVSIYSVFGQKVLNISPKSSLSKIDISSFKNGLYLVEIESNGKKLATKIIKR